MDTKMIIIIALIVLVLVVVIVMIMKNRGEQQAGEQQVAPPVTTVPPSATYPMIPGGVTPSQYVQSFVAPSTSPNATVVNTITSAAVKSACLAKCTALHPLNKSKRDACKAGC